MCGLGDEARTSAEGHIVPQPAERHGDAISQADQEVDMGQAPEHPAGKSLQGQMPQPYHGSFSADRGEVPLMSVVERNGCRSGAGPGGDDSGGIAAHFSHSNNRIEHR